MTPGPSLAASPITVPVPMSDDEFAALCVLADRQRVSPQEFIRRALRAYREALRMARR